MGKDLQPSAPDLMMPAGNIRHAHHHTLHSLPDRTLFRIKADCVSLVRPHVSGWTGTPVAADCCWRIHGSQDPGQWARGSLKGLGREAGGWQT